MKTRDEDARFAPNRWDAASDQSRRADGEEQLVLATQAPLAPVVEARIQAFLGNGPLAHETLDAPRYYGDLLAWALERHRCAEGWDVAGAMDSMEGYFCN